ncbi:MAG: ATP phosphoribosyltransferase regulatory subunit [Halothiobacillaceae bacterium]|nr:ATP phosphoribosyltransferase regulatory subunit [Halothiobacillaceae bacterium]
MTNDRNRWLLPAGIEELLPERAWPVEALRRRLIDHYARAGYELVIPPMVEFVDSLLIGLGEDLDLRTFKIIDQLTGRLMGLRADMTPQMARIDAHALAQEGVTRLCYLGSVLHTLPDGFAGSRSPMQVGVELFGHSGVSSDLEVIGLMLDTLRIAGVRNVVLDLGHVGLYRAFAAQAGFDEATEDTVFDLLRRKALPELDALLSSLGLPEYLAANLRLLARLNGGTAVLGAARERLSRPPEAVGAILDHLDELLRRLRERHADVRFNIDLAELHGYRYQTGTVFAAYVPGRGEEIARGGRYDEIGRVFGRARPATGFSADVRSLIELGEAVSAPGGGILAPDARGDAGLWSTILRLRDEGERVVCALPGEPASRHGCDRQLVLRDGHWQIIELK